MSDIRSEYIMLSEMKVFVATAAPLWYANIALAVSLSYIFIKSLIYSAAAFDDSSGSYRSSVWLFIVSPYRNAVGGVSPQSPALVDVW